MLTIEKALEVSKSENQTTIDSRMLARMTQFMTVEQVEQVGFVFNDIEAREKHVPAAFTQEAVMAQLKADVAFGFEKALNQRGISSSLMYEVVSGWLQVLEIRDQFTTDYAQYGLPLFKQVAVHFGFDNPIGNDVGDESHYASE